MNESAKPEGLGAFYGVFLPCFLTILGVILFLRMGWVAGNLGLVQSWIMITLANSIIFITALSISSIATNMKIKGGGAYFIISRSFGVEGGAAMGLPLYFAQTLGASFYAVGFAEALQPLLPMMSIAEIASLTLIVLVILGSASASFATKSQIIIFVMIVVSLGGLLLGGPPPEGFGEVEPTVKVGFWAVFAVFFPAVTGITAGVGMSGDLTNPAKSLPKGIIAAVGVGYIVYMVTPWLLLKWVPPEVLRSDLMVMNKLAPAAWLIGLGIWGATLSSSLNSLISAPRTLQALARDQIAFRFLGKGTLKDDTPRVATGLSFLIALAGVWVGDLNQIASVLSMFFLMTYGLLNFAAAAESLMQNPSWRPSFKVTWWVSLVGGIGCFTVMFILNAIATLAALSIGLLLLIWMYKRKLNRRWEDIRLGFWQYLSRMVLYRMRNSKIDIRSWRPNLLVFTGAPTSRWHLVELAQALADRRGFMTLCSMIPDVRGGSERASTIQNGMKSYLEGREIQALVSVKTASHPLEGAKQMVRYHGMGSVEANTIILGQSEEKVNKEAFANLVREVWALKKNLILAEEQDVDEEDALHQKRIDIWWGGQNHNQGFMLAIAYMMQQSQHWPDYTIRLLNVLGEGKDEKKIEEWLTQLLQDARIEGEAKVIVPLEGEKIVKIIQRESRWSASVFLGLREPQEGEADIDYGDYLFNLQEGLPKCALTALVLVAEELPFIELFD
ncbi:MAG: Na-K-Cl cotransporter [SAR324 cluster bacterium]|nr:Na-K-Cl cotransporter [SAR324 cluster bacterium]